MYITHTFLNRNALPVAPLNLYRLNQNQKQLSKKLYNFAKVLGLVQYSIQMPQNMLQNL